jgi:hypothetical protein
MISASLSGLAVETGSVDKHFNAGVVYRTEVIL